MKILLENYELELKYEVETDLYAVTENSDGSITWEFPIGDLNIPTQFMWSATFPMIDDEYYVLGDVEIDDGFFMLTQRSDIEYN
jgi:hypothetical protein